MIMIESLVGPGWRHESALQHLAPVTADICAADTLIVAPALIGLVLVTRIDGLLTGGRIVEVEAYTQEDPASHSFSGQTQRNRSMFGPPGTVYVYLSYGMHLCFNLATEGEGRGCAVLIRALEPLYALETMRLRRGTNVDRNLASGPGKLTRALGISKELDGSLITASDEIALFSAPESSQVEVRTSPRIGITKAAEKPWRFSVAGSRWVSVP